MIILEDFEDVLKRFKNQIEQPEGVFITIQSAFQHFLFPEAFPPVSSIDQLPSARGYQRAAIAGYVLCSANMMHKVWAMNVFQEEMAWLQRNPLPDLLGGDKVCLLGLVLGQLSLAPVSAENEWWRKLLHEVDTHSPGLRALLEALIWGRPIIKELDPEGLYQMVFQLLSMPETIDEATLATFLITIRKRSYPYVEGDSFHSLLTLYVEDCAIKRLMVAAQNFRLSFHQQVRDEVMAHQQALSNALAASLAMRARMVVTLILLSLMAWMITVSVIFFVQGIDGFPAKELWEDLKWAFLLFSGPVGGVLWLVRLVYFMIRGRKPSLDIFNLTDRYAAYLVKRWKKRLGILPSSVM